LAAARPLACSDDAENIKVLNEAAALWTAFLAGTEHFGQKVNKKHHLVGASDTHDVLYPGIANTKGSASIYHSGKARTYAYLGTTANDIKTNGLAFTKAVQNGNSYISYGPILNPGAKVFGEKYKAENGVFEISVNIESLNGLKDVVVLSSLGSGEYVYEGKNASGEDEEFTIENVLITEPISGNSESFTYKADLKGADSAWFAIMVIDNSDSKMFAISNPYWVSK
jgi:hypothetical protein